MKIAVCLSGMMRNFELTYPYFKKYIIDEYDPDIFFSGYPNKNGNEYCDKNLVNLYNPKKYILQEYSDELRKKICDNEEKYLKNKRPETIVQNIFSQFYNVLNADMLRQQYEVSNSFKYDVVIRSRIDIYYFKKFSFEELEKASSGDLIIPDFWNYKEVSNLSITDNFAMSNSNNIKIYSSLYSKIDGYFNEGCLFHPETLLGYHLKKENLSISHISGKGWYDFNSPDGIKIDRKDF